MAKHLTPTDIQTIVDMLYSWDSELSWDLLCDRAAAFVGKRPTRQSLSSHPNIKAAFIWAKSNIKTEVLRSPLPSSLKIASERIKRLESEVGSLKLQNSALLERFLVWQYNATNAGMHQWQLEAALPRIDRERSDGVKKGLRVVPKKNIK